MSAYHWFLVIWMIVVDLLILFRHQLYRFAVFCVGLGFALYVVCIMARAPASEREEGGKG